ncbi:RagB/SusD family nutrient uptake outer membrane protein [Chryseolinea lacunae]|uniref:RagB/SusD family nutrient uptake outer membrane protein n=1 Tax=Chryseolinea lacunae TaxID=2801331 RepID=A0ABS1L244_9BACT|nr:RagB/SusD family nutrient uptake outer membrane protein [Chryseolinea lacunae]MBL0745788.1 RagB/SusD family nutrient uptake outer membrane protein [Chryseolinea lacunae]
MKRHTIVLLSLFAVAACTDELNQVNPNSLTTASFWKTQADFEAGLAASYKMFKQVDNGYWGVRGVELSNGRGDDMFIRNDVKDLYQLSTFTNNATTGVPAGIFTGAYNAIFRANQVIENLPASELSDALKTRLTAEAKFLRAANHFILVINFGSVPIVTAVPKSSAEAAIAKSPEADVWAQIISDLKEASQGLPVSNDASAVGRATKGSALGYLGKAYVYTKKWSEAENTFKLLAQPDGHPQAPFTYDLLTNYEENFLAGSDNNKESLFEIQMQNVGGTAPWNGENAGESQGVTTAQEFAPTEVAGWFEMFPSDKIFNEFEKEKTIDNDFDPRMYASLVWNYPGALYYNLPYASFSNPFNSKARIRKYQNWRNNNEGIWISEINEKVLRYADILLMYAEALTLQSRTAEAYPLVNRIRERAHLAPLAAGLSADDMMDEIRHQRMIEFYREGLRFYDLKRWGLIQQEMSNSDKVGREFYEDKFQYFPIPQNEINTNIKMTQNDPW